MNSFLRYLPQEINGLLKIPLFIPTTPSISVSIIADVPMTIHYFDKSLSWQVSDTSAVYFRYSLLNASRLLT